MLRAVLKFNCFYCNGDCYFVIHFIRRPQIKNSLKRNSASLGCKFQGRAQGSSSQPSELELNHSPRNNIWLRYLLRGSYSSLSHHRDYAIDAMMAMTCWRWCDYDEAMIDCTINIPYRIIAPSRYRLFCTCAVWRKWRQDYIVVFSCYDLSIANHISCMLVLNAM